jgi:hypothetical protein
MLQVLSVCVGAVALTASAQTVWVADTFEAEGVGYTNAVIGSAASLYKAHIWGAQDDHTNLVWSATGKEDSAIRAFEGSYAEGRPITTENAQLQALELATEGQTLTRYVNFTQTGEELGIPVMTPAPIDLGTSPIWVDTLIKFRPSEDDPEITGDDIKVALWVNVNSNLVVRHYPMTGSGEPSADPMSSVFEEVMINPDEWCRLSIEVGDKWNVGQTYPHFSIYLNGNVLTHADGAYVNLDGYPTAGGGSIFFSRSGIVAQLSQVSFQGTGFVDDLVVADEHAPFGTPHGILLTLAFDASKLTVLDDVTPVASNGTVNADATLTITAADFYRVAGVAGEGVTFTPVTGDFGDKSVIGTIAAAAEAEVTITANMIDDSAASTGFGGYNVQASKLAAWAQANSLTETLVNANANDYLDDYLLNVAPGTDAELEITDIQINPDGSITIEVGASQNLPEGFEGVNGTLKVYAKDSLDADWGEPEEEHYLAIGAGQTATITIDEGYGNFFKAVVK